MQLFSHFNISETAICLTAGDLMKYGMQMCVVTFSFILCFTKRIMFYIFLWILLSDSLWCPSQTADVTWTFLSYAPHHAVFNILQWWGLWCFFSTKSMLCILHISSYLIDCCFEFSGIDSKEWYFKFEGCYTNIFHSSSITITLHTGHSGFLLSLFLNKATSKYNDLKSAINYFPNDSALWTQRSRRESGCSCTGHQGPQLRCRECLWAGLRAHGLFSHSQGFCLISETEVSLTWGLSASRGSH